MEVKIVSLEINPHSILIGLEDFMGGKKFLLAADDTVAFFDTSIIPTGGMIGSIFEGVEIEKNTVVIKWYMNSSVVNTTAVNYHTCTGEHVFMDEHSDIVPDDVDECVAAPFSSFRKSERTKIYRDKR